jgi:hypothetical protein
MITAGGRCHENSQKPVKLQRFLFNTVKTHELKDLREVCASLPGIFSIA